jgi:hypothetical protein
MASMKKGETRAITTVTVTGSLAVARPDGTTALVLHTREAGSIAFEVDARAVEVLRRDLAAIETMLRRPQGQA